MTTDNNLNNRIKEWYRKAEENLISARVTPTSFPIIPVPFWCKTT